MGEESTLTVSVAVACIEGEVPAADALEPRRHSGTEVQSFSRANAQDKVSGGDGGEDRLAIDLPSWPAQDGQPPSL